MLAAPLVHPSGATFALWCSGIRLAEDQQLCGRCPFLDFLSYALHAAAGSSSCQAAVRAYMCLLRVRDCHITCSSGETIAVGMRTPLLHGHSHGSPVLPAPVQCPPARQQAPARLPRAPLTAALYPAPETWPCCAATALRTAALVSVLCWCLLSEHFETLLKWGLWATCLSVTWAPAMPELNKQVWVLCECLKMNKAGCIGVRCPAGLSLPNKREMAAQLNKAFLHLYPPFF